MNHYKKNAVTAGVLLLAAIVTGVTGKLITLNITTGADVLANIAAQPSQFLFGELLFALMGFCCTGIAIWLYPALKKHNPGMAAGALAFRIIEGGIFVAYAVLQMGLVFIAKQAAVADGALLETLTVSGEVFIHSTEMLGAVGGALGFCFGAALYYIIMIQSCMVPRWLSIWGLVAILTHTIEVIMVVFGESSTSNLAMMLNLPIFLNELVLGGWLIFKGFDFSHMKSIQTAK